MSKTMSYYIDRQPSLDILLRYYGYNNARDKDDFKLEYGVNPDEEYSASNILSSIEDKISYHKKVYNKYKGKKYDE